MNARFAIGAVAAFLFFLAGCPGNPPPSLPATELADSPATQPACPPSLDEIVERKLAAPLAKADFAKSSFQDVVLFIREASGINIYVKWKALEAAGISKDDPVNVRLRDTTFGKALQVVLEDVGGVTPLGYLIDEGVLTISLREDLSKQFWTIVYDVSDLVFNFGAHSPWNEVEDPDAQLMYSLAPTPEHFDPDSPGRIEDPARGIKALLNVIRATVDPDSGNYDSWWPHGLSDVRGLGNWLIVTQSKENHKAVRRLLETLREDRSVPLGLAVVRSDDAQAGEALRALAARGDVQAALRNGQKLGRWRLDRCGVELADKSKAVRAKRWFHRQSQAFGPDGKALVHELVCGYEIGVAVAGQPGKEGRFVSVAYRSAWIDAGEDPSRDSPLKPIGGQNAANAFHFRLRDGQSAVREVIPPGARDGAVYVVVWLPKR